MAGQEGLEGYSNAKLRWERGSEREVDEGSLNHRGTGIEEGIRRVGLSGGKRSSRALLN